MSSTVRLVLSAVISFCFYFVWSYWANSMASDDQGLVLRSAIVQGTLSATITLLFTFILEKLLEVVMSPLSCIMTLMIVEI